MNQVALVPKVFSEEKNKGQAKKQRGHPVVGYTRDFGYNNYVQTITHRISRYLVSYDEWWKETGEYLSFRPRL